ncbi:Uncharacterised protein [Mycobacteroides abscessus subsp. massiliense]|nr:Uncharacterised protein [Mycobacteroides abscessus subsp. massiliense]
MPHLRLDGVEVGQAAVRVGPIERQKIRELGHRNAFEGLESVVAPKFSEVVVLASDNLESREG